MRSLDDTIVAISTPVGEGGIGIVRLSGPEALPVLRRMFVPAQAHVLPVPESHRLYYGQIVDSESGATVDEVLASYMRGPRTYTRQDVVEINCHGGTVAMQRVLRLALREGARLAEPGEFTLRAFVNGRLDLAQAEAVLDIIQAKTEASLRMAVGQLEGRLSNRLQTVRAELLAVLAYLEATVDFVEEDIPFEDIDPPLAQSEEALRTLCAEAEEGIIYRQGIHTAIVGRPNVGKSSLLNALLRAERAIVTPIPGTTRDTLEETINLRGVPLCLVDTAGITESEDLVEQLGVERSRAALARADLVLFVVDGSELLTAADREVAGLLEAKASILVVNKADLLERIKLDDLLPGAERIRVSALTGAGLKDLEDAVEQAVFSGQVRASDAPLVSSPRHRESLNRALDHVQSARAAHAQGMPNDLVSIDVTSAIEELGEITGESATEDLLDTIFARFCIGK